MVLNYELTKSEINQTTKNFLKHNTKLHAKKRFGDRSYERFRSRRRVDISWYQSIPLEFVFVM